MLADIDNCCFLSFSENINNENSNDILKKKKTKKEKKYLNHKRKRISKIINLMTDEKLIEKDNSKFKLQDFSKNALSVIISYLSFDDVLKLKNVGSRNIYNYIQELIELKRSKGCFKLNLKKSIKAKIPLSDSDSIPCKKYFYSNMVDMDFIPSKPHIKYMIYHKQSNKYYYLFKQVFNYYFCSCDKDEITDKEYENYVILFKIKELDYVQKFQFIDENKVAFFSIYKVIVYDISNDEYKYNIIYLSHTCDFILFKKNLNLLIIPHSYYDYISFFVLNKSSTKGITKEKKKIVIQHENNCESKNGQIIELCGNLIGYFCSCFNYVKILDCKKIEFVKNIKLNSNIKNVEFNKKYLIVYTDDNSINFFDSITFENKYDFKLGNCDIKDILLFEPSYFDNIFLLIKNNNKSCLIYFEKDNFFSFIPIDNEINNKGIKNNDYITNSLSKQINIDNDSMLEINTKIICTEYSKNEYIINNYTLIL